MNFDVPFIQELGSSRRLPHSIGVCHIALGLAVRSALKEEDREILLAAALLHDAAIPPYGHLVETVLRKRYPDFDHEVMLKDLLFGTAHATNQYQQILPGRSLRVPKVLKQHNIDPESILRLVRPPMGEKTAISADIDLDNIDNIHRMGVLLGWPGVKENLQELIRECSVRSDFGLQFKDDALKNLRFWQEIRQRIYTLIIAHPQCVAENAFQNDLVTQAVEAEVISPDNWHIVEPKFESELRNHPKTKDLAERLISGRRYALIDYVWFKNYGLPPVPSWKSLEKHIAPLLPQLPANQGYFLWVEHGLISRAVCAELENGDRKSLGESSTSLFVARVHKDADLPGHRPGTKGQISWREAVMEAFESLVPDWEHHVSYPENYRGVFLSSDDAKRQLELY